MGFPFLSDIETRGRDLGERIRSIRAIVASSCPPNVNDPGVTNAIRMTMEVRDRVSALQVRHNFSSARDVIYAALLLGLATLERLEPSVPVKRVAVPRLHRQVRVLSENEVSRLRDEGYGASQ